MSTRHANDSSHSRNAMIVVRSYLHRIEELQIMTLDGTQQPADMAHPDVSAAPEIDNNATQMPEHTPIPTSIQDAPQAAAVPATPSPQTPPEAASVLHAEPEQPAQLEQPQSTQPEQPSQEQPSQEQPSQETPTLVYKGTSQTTPTPPPATIVSPASHITPTPPPVTGTIALQSPAQQRRRRRSVLAVISAICIVALLASGSYLLFNLLTSHTESDVARIVPSDTVALVSVDLVAAAAHGQRVTAGILGNAPGQGDAFKLMTGLDWEKDVLPWVGRDMAFAVFQRQPPYGSPNSGQGASATKANGTLGGAFLLQSRDDGAAQAAMRKASMYQQNLGSTVTMLDYHGLTLYHTSLVRGDESGTTLAAGNGWAIVAGDLPAARTLIDRLTGDSSAADTLAANNTYRDAQSTLPHNRFGTVFLNVRTLVKGFSYTSSGQADIISTLASTYPIAVGYLAWTPNGIRAQFTFPAAHTVDVGLLAGDATTLANVTPASAFAYTGIANLGAMLRSQKAMTAQANIATGAPAALLGLPPTDPALQRPAAFSLIGEPSGKTGFLTLLNAPDQADAIALLGQSAEQQHWTRQATTVAGASVTAYYAKLPPTQSTPANVTAPAENIETAVPGAQLVGLGTWLDDTLIFASDATVMTDAIHTIRDHSPNLAQDAHFQQLVREAPHDGSATTFLDLPRATMTGSTATSVLAASLASRFAAILVTHEWNGKHYQTTADLLLPG